MFYNILYWYGVQLDFTELKENMYFLTKMFIIAEIVKSFEN